MKLAAPALAALVLAAPAAMAQTDQTPVRIAPAYNAPAYPSYSEERLSPGQYRDCVDREYALRDRRERIDAERANIDRDADAIARAGARLDAELRSLDRRDATAVANYNARSDAHNRRVETQNQRVAELNQRAALLNGDAADQTAGCANRIYTPQYDYRSIR